MTELDDWRRELFGKRIEPLFNEWSKRLGLTHWEIACDVGELPNALAQCEVNKRHGHHARLTFTDAVFYSDDRTREIITIHELLHIPLDDLAQFAERNMNAKDREWFGRLLETFTADLSEILYNLVRQDGDDSI